MAGLHRLRDHDRHDQQSEMQPNYFTCTLGQATQYQQGKTYSTVPGLISEKAKQEPDLPAVAFYDVQHRPWTAHILSFKDVHSGSLVLAEELSHRLRARKGQTVALLCPSSADFLFNWLGLMQLGHPVLLIAPQCSPASIAQLCSVCDVADLLFDDVYEELASKAVSEKVQSEAVSFQAVPLPFIRDNIFDVLKRRHPSETLPHETVHDSDVAYLHHTSGTSSGVPKPIPQTHRAAVGVLPCLDGRQSASFTTTPLYHGGIADLFRAWSSNALIWLFPSKQLPITATHVAKCLDVAQEQALSGSVPSVRYFSSVPYILQMLANDEKGLPHLQKMDIVGVGGAALPSEVGDSLVQKDVNLISRFGSAECGFLMSSHRDYAKDKEWQYLRSTPGGEQLQFEQNEESLSELIVLPQWPHMAKRNREDGSYATADIFASHRDIPNAWKYDSRSDAQLTLITGKKFDPAPIEDAIKASSEILHDVLIFGNGKPYPGALLFRSEVAKAMSDQELVATVAPTVARLNQGNQSHAKISQKMLVPMPHVTNGLEKSSKGTILRNIAEKTYAKDIESAYAEVMTKGDVAISDDEIPQTIRKIVLSVTRDSKESIKDISDNTDLFSIGVDSVACIQIRHALSSLLPESKKPALPLTVVEDAGTIARLSDFVHRLRSGEKLDNHQDQRQLMLDLVKEYSLPPSAIPTVHVSERDISADDHKTGIHVLLTGPTGSLGSHVLHQLLLDPRVSHVSLLVRGSSVYASKERVIKALTSRKLEIPSNFETKTTILSCRLSEADLGISKQSYDELVETVDIVLHLAWSVNFLISLRTIAGTHLAGLRNLLNLALHSKTSLHFVFCSSVASIANFDFLSPALKKGEAVIPEAYIPDPIVSGPTGYAQSKWVGEAICAAANESTNLRRRISVCRVGQLSGATNTGVWSTSEAYPMLFASAKVTGVLPDLKNEVLNWLPVDVAAKAFLEDALEYHTTTGKDDLPVYHVLNPDMGVKWSALTQWLKPLDSFTVVSADEWLTALTKLKAEDQTKDHPALRLLGFWQRAYGSESFTDVPSNVENRSRQRYQMSKTYERMPALRICDETSMVNAEYVQKLWHWIQVSL